MIFKKLTLKTTGALEGLLHQKNNLMISKNFIYFRLQRLNSSTTT